MFFQHTNDTQNLLVVIIIMFVSRMGKNYFSTVSVLVYLRFCHGLYYGFYICLRVLLSNLLRFPFYYHHNFVRTLYNMTYDEAYASRWKYKFKFYKFKSRV